MNVFFLFIGLGLFLMILGLLATSRPHPYRVPRRGGITLGVQLMLRFDVDPLPYDRSPKLPAQPSQRMIASQSNALPVDPEVIRINRRLERLR